MKKKNSCLFLLFRGGGDKQVDSARGIVATLSALVNSVPCRKVVAPFQSVTPDP